MLSFNAMISNERGLPVLWRVVEFTLDAGWLHVKVKSPAGVLVSSRTFFARDFVLPSQSVRLIESLRGILFQKSVWFEERKNA